LAADGDALALDSDVMLPFTDGRASIWVIPKNSATVPRTRTRSPGATARQAGELPLDERFGDRQPPGSSCDPDARETARQGRDREDEPATEFVGTFGLMTIPATGERRALCDLFDELGPDAPTLCEGWQTVDLAAHLVVRERRPDAAPGVLLKPLASYTEKVQQRIAQWPWAELVERIRTGPPRLSPTRIEAVDRAVNTVEFFVHHEDVRRARSDWSARELDAALVDDLYEALKRAARLMTRKAPAGIVLEPSDGHPAIVANRGSPSVKVRGPVGELTLFVYGRQAHALVELDGPPDAVASVRAASFGL
jgi:uncharacterized protein (TIGR03085 family)